MKRIGQIAQHEKIHGQFIIMDGLLGKDVKWGVIFPKKSNKKNKDEYQSKECLLTLGVGDIKLGGINCVGTSMDN